jgi:predicted TIM-barrel fold metal-dependent hydrolase
MATPGIIDADAHYLEGIDELATYLDDDDPWKERFDFAGNPHHTVDLFPKSTGDRNVYGRITRSESSYPDAPMAPEEIPTTMEHLGIDEIVMISHKLLTFGRLHADDERPVKFANAYVDYMLDRVVDPAEGIYTLIPVPYQDVDASVDLIDRVGDEDGMVGVCLITAGAEPPLGNRRYDPIYERAEAKGLPVIFHTGGAGIDEFHQRGYEKFIETHVLGFLTNNASQLTSVVISGVPEKFPDLDIAFLESGLFYVPMMMHRLDAEYLKRPSEAPYLEKRPSEYIREFYFGTQPLELPDNEEFLEWTIEMIGGADRLLYASDYPHWDYDPPSVIQQLSFLSRDEKAKILGGNAAEVYGI